MACGYKYAAACLKMFNCPFHNRQSSNTQISDVIYFVLVKGGNSAFKEFITRRFYIFTDYYFKRLCYIPLTA